MKINKTTCMVWCLQISIFYIKSTLFSIWIIIIEIRFLDIVSYWEIIDFIMSKPMSFCIQYDISIGSFHLSVSVLHLCCGTLCIPWNVKLQICVECQLTWVVRSMADDIILCKGLWMKITELLEERIMRIICKNIYFTKFCNALILF